MYEYDNDHKICQNCAHWDAAHMFQLPIYDNKGKLQCHRPFAACKVNAVEPDAGECLPMMAADGDCLCHAQAFTPSVDYLYLEHEAAHINDGLPGMQLDPAELRPRPYYVVA